MSELQENAVQSCLNFPVNVQSLPPKGLILRLETNDGERAALAEAHGLAAVHAFSADFHVRPWKKRGVKVEGAIHAQITQLCIISAEPVDNVIDRHFEAFFIPDDSRLAKAPSGAAEEMILDPEGLDAPELFHGNIINIGAVAEEFFELAIDLYPRKEGIELEDIWTEADAAREAQAPRGSGKKSEIKPASPFAVLERLKK